MEAFQKRPSAIDHEWPPLVVGLLLGEARLRLWRRLSEGGAGARVGAAVLDPFGSLERAAFGAGR